MAGGSIGLHERALVTGSAGVPWRALCAHRQCAESLGPCLGPRLICVVPRQRSVLLTFKTQKQGTVGVSFVSEFCILCV